MIESLLIGITNLFIGIAGKHYWSVYQKVRKTRGQSAILAGFSDSTKFVFPPREDVESALLPRISTEDFMAMNNMISAFINCNHIPPYKMVDSNKITDQDKKENNLILICSSKTNKITKEALTLLRRTDSSWRSLIPYFEVDQGTNKIYIRWNKGNYPSESYGQKGPDFTDIAMIIKARSPWAAQHKILIVAGIRGIGTWGAAEFLKKWWKALYDEKGNDRKKAVCKEGDFAALVEVQYRDSDIKNVKLLHVVDLCTQDTNLTGPN